MTVVDEVRGFNRFYTREIGLLAEHLPGGAFTLPEARVLYELARGGERTAAGIVRHLRMDPAHVSRIVARLRARGLVRSRVSPSHGKHRLLALTDAGHESFAALESGTRTELETILSPLGAAGRARLVGAMREIGRLLGEAQAGEVQLRFPAPGDLGAIAQRQMRLYHDEYGWDWTFEGLVCEILGKFVAHFDPAREDAWVAERDGAILGSVFLMQGDTPGTAKLRLLYVEVEARGLGLGRQLVATCVARARALGYDTLTLWTNDILHAARRIYVESGFRLVAQAPHRSFGHDLMGQTWDLDLRQGETG